MGARKAVWSGTDGAGNAVATGIYFANLQGISGASTKRLIYMK
jgi:hypothetical protein